MSLELTLTDRPSLADLRVLLSRAARIEDGSVRLIAAGRVLAVYVAALYPVGLLDETPTVLGLRTFALAEQAELDEVVPIGSLAQRLERLLGETPEGSSDPVRVQLPPGVHTVTWTAISPPRGGWRPLGSVEPERLEIVARAGIDQVAAAVPEATGELAVRRVRSDVWSRPVDEQGLDHVPTGAAFAAFSLGFLGDDAVALFETGSWTRLTSARGHVLVRRRAWTLAR